MATKTNGFLGPPLTKDYRPSVWGWWSGWTRGQNPLQWQFDLEEMRMDPRCQFAMRILKAPLYQASWTVPADNKEISNYVDATLKRFWKRSLDHALTICEYGNSPAEPLWVERNGYVMFDDVKEIYYRDAVPLQVDGMLAGIRVKNVDLFPPRAQWITLDAENGRLWGKSRFRTMWEPWKEKSGRKGAKDARKLWYLKNCFHGGSIRHPPGSIEDETGKMVPCQEYARQILEQLEAGGILVLPNTRDEMGNFLWEYAPPAINGDLHDVREYPKDLDIEILEGAGIPNEIISAAQSGSGWSGRSVPFIVYLTGEDHIANAIIDAIDQQICRPGVNVNFGRNAKYQIIPKSFVEMAKEDEDKQKQQQASPPGGITQAVHGAVMSRMPDIVRMPEGWLRYEGPNGAGWMNPQTGEKVYSFGLSLDTEDDPDEKAELMAEILYGLYGDDALSLVEDKSVKMAVGKWEPLAHPRGRGGRFIKRGSEEAVASAQEAISQVIKGGDHDHTPETLAGHLQILTVQQLREVARQHGKKIPAGTVRDDLVNGIKARLTEGKDKSNGQDRTGSESTGAEATGDGGKVADKTGGPLPAGPDKGRDDGSKPARDGTAGRVPASVDHVNKRLDRFAEFFRSKGQHETAGWMDKLRDHVGKVGTDAALASLGEEKIGPDGKPVAYEGGWDDMGHFAEQYLDRHGITPIYDAGDLGAKDRLISTKSPSQGTIGRNKKGDFVPKDPTLANKLEEAKRLPGLEASEDINTVMGRPVTHLTPDVTAKMDERFGKGKWIIKPYGEMAFNSQGIYFPQRVQQISQDAKNTIWSAGEQVGRHGFHFRRDGAGKVVGLQHQNGDVYDFGSERYQNTIGGDVRHWADRAAEVAPNEQAAALPNGGKEFMAQPAFEAVGVSDADRAAGKTIAPGESRVHIVTRNGKAELIPHSTWIKGENLPVVFEDDDTRAMAQAAVDAINRLPASERQGQIYAPDILRSRDGYKVVEANPANDTGSSGYLGNNPFIIDAYVSHLTGRTPGHVQFVRKLLSGKRGTSMSNAQEWTPARPPTRLSISDPIRERARQAVDAAFPLDLGAKPETKPEPTPAVAVETVQEPPKQAPEGVQLSEAVQSLADEVKTLHAKLEPITDEEAVKVLRESMK